MKFNFIIPSALVDHPGVQPARQHTSHMAIPSGNHRHSHHINYTIIDYYIPTAVSRSADCDGQKVHLHVHGTVITCFLFMANSRAIIVFRFSRGFLHDPCCKRFVTVVPLLVLLLLLFALSSTIGPAHNSSSLTVISRLNRFTAGIAINFYGATEVVMAIKLPFL